LPATFVEGANRQSWQRHLIGKEDQQRWLGESEQSDKWFPCLIAALMPRSRRDHVQTITTEP
jgi:hypothetical protein